MVDDTSLSPNPVHTGNAFLRVIWMAAIPFVLLCILLIADQERWTLGKYDIALVVLVVAALGARAVDALHYAGATARGEPADRSHVIGYSVRLVLLAGGAWFVAQSVAV